MYAFPTTWDKLGSFPIATLWAGSIPLLYLFSKQRARDALKLCAAGVIYSIARYVLMILVFIYLMTFVQYKEEVCRIDIFWDARVILLSFLPLIYLLCRRAIPLKAQDTVFTYEAVALSAIRRKALVYFSLTFFFLGLVYGFQDPGKEKGGRVLLDEKHSGWEKNSRKMDTEWYGNESGYNFYWMAEFINHYFPLQRNFEEITPELSSCLGAFVVESVLP